MDRRTNCWFAQSNQRRKTLVNAIKNSTDINITKEEISDALDKMELSQTIRGEALSLEQFCILSNILTK